MSNHKNIPLAILQQSIGKSLTQSPSAFGRWLDPTVVLA